MDFDEFSSLLLRGCRENGISEPDGEQIRRFAVFTDLLTEANARMNLTAIREVPEIVQKHYVDSLTVLKFLPKGARVLDLGCGGGFPIVPLAIMRPDLTLIGLDATDKKIRFVSESLASLGLTNASAISGRAEDPVVRQSLGRFDVVVSRAMARLNILSELSFPYLKIGGKLAAMKGSKGAEELAEAANALKILGSGAPELHEFDLIGDENEPRTIIEAQKEHETLAKYPRAYGAILKKPL